MSSEKHQKTYKMIMLVVLTMLITFLLTTVVMYKFVQTNGETKYIISAGDNSGLSAELNQFHKVIEKYFLGDINEDKLTEGAKKGYIEGLGDEYTEYITKEEWEKFETNTMGNYVGIGIYLSKNTTTNQIIIIAPIKGSPADRAGIKPGDIILKVDEIEYSGEDLTVASNKIKGEAGTKVKLQIKREDQIMDLEIERTEVKLTHVESKVYENQIGYISIPSFDEDTSEEFKSKLEQLKKQNITSLILDLRNNGGGIVQEATKIAETMLQKDQLILTTADKNDNRKEYKVTTNEPMIQVPIVVLTNEYTASASEILAGALKDHQVAKVVGTKTYGKGVIQEVFKLTDGSAIKMTVEEYYTPNNQKINKVGITPDEVVELPEDLQEQLTIPEAQDTQLQKAIAILK